MSGWQRRLSRALDLAAAAAGVILLAPLFGAIAIVIKVDDHGPVFYRHPRVGKGNCPLPVLKFRTMTPGADRSGQDITAQADPRVTRCGRWLRAWKLDELPQLWNVLQGTMRLVGPRPETARHVAMFAAAYRELLTEAPGITDPASIAFRRESELLEGPDPERRYVEEVLPAKLALSLAYHRRRSVGSDLLVIWRTLLPGSGERNGRGNSK